MGEEHEQKELSLYAATHEWLASDRKAVNRWWWFWNKIPLGHALFCVVGIPLGCFLMWYLHTGHGSAHAAALPVYVVKNIVLALFTWVAMLFAARVILIEQLKHALSIRFTETGIELKNRFANESIMWSRVKRVLPTASNEYVVCTADGDFYFPADQQWSASAAERLCQAASISRADYSIVMSLDPKHKMTALLLAIPFAFAILAQFLGPFLHDQQTTGVYLLTSLIFMTPFILCFALMYYIQVHKTPETFLAGESIFVVDREGEHHINLDEVRKVWMIGDAVWISTAKGSWSVPATHIVDQSLPTISPEKNKVKMKSLAVKNAKQAMLALRPKRLS